MAEETESIARWEANVKRLCGRVFVLGRNPGALRLETAGMAFLTPKRTALHGAALLLLVLGWPGMGPAPIVSARAQTNVAAAEVTSQKALGSKSAPVTIEVFSDFQCPMCRRTFQDTLRPLIDSYVAEGKVYLVHRDFPLPMHNHSREAARWANAAAKIGKFAQVEEALYSKQDTWAANGNIEAIVAGVLKPAELKKVRHLMQQGAQLDAGIDRDVALGKSRQVNQTPTLFVTHNGRMETLPASGVTFNLLKQYIDYLLRQ